MARTFKVENAHEFTTKYHIGDKFKYGKIIAVITKIYTGYEAYELRFIDSKTHQEINVYNLKNAWWTPKELDDFTGTIKEILSRI